MATSPYEADLHGVDPLDALDWTHVEILRAIDRWAREDYERPYGPGKWTGRELIIHLAQCELVFGSRARFALTTPGYTVVPFEQDDWMPLDATADPMDALAAYRGLRALNAAFFRSLTPAQLDHPCLHPQLGEISVRFILTSLTGHEAHHLPHVRAIGPARRA